VEQCANDRAFHAVQRQLRLAGIANVLVSWRKIKIPEDLILVFAPVVPVKCLPDEQDGWTCLCEEAFSASYILLKMPCCGKLIGWNVPINGSCQVNVRGIELAHSVAEKWSLKILHSVRVPFHTGSV